MSKVLHVMPLDAPEDRFWRTSSSDYLSDLYRNFLLVTKLRRRKNMLQERRWLVRVLPLFFPQGFEEEAGLDRQSELLIIAT